MNTDPIDILGAHQNNPKLGSAAKQALRFVEGAKCKFLQTPGPGQPSLAVVRMYEIRKSLPKFKPKAFIGLDESIESLRESDATVRLVVIETEKGVVSMWLAEKSNVPLGIVIGKFEV